MENRINFMSVLPPQIISSIASRLPIKSLLNSMLVCKLWRNLFPDPFSAKRDHAQFLFYNPQLTNSSLKFAILDDDPPNRLIDPKTQIIEMKPISLPPTFLYGNPEKLLHIDPHRVSSCNGLVCFSLKNKYLYLCNPVLGEFVSVPEPSINLFHSDMYELGFCSSSNQYKLMRFVHSHYADETAELEILTIGSPAVWRRHARVVPSGIWDKAESAICARGALHWLLLSQEKSGRYILTFDLAGEEFGSIPLPPIDDDKEVHRLGLMDHCLVATAGHSLPLGLEIWARKEFTWSKNWVVDATESLDAKTLSPSWLVNMIPRKSSVDGRIFMTYLHRRLYCYDPKARLVTDFVFSIPKDSEPFASGVNPWAGIIGYTATLVSPQKLMACELDSPQKVTACESSKKREREGTLGKQDGKKRRKTEKTETMKKLRQGESKLKSQDRKKRRKTKLFYAISAYLRARR